MILQRWVGRYELIHRLAHGGMATVYLGRAKGKAGFEKVVAVKVIHPHLAAEAEFVGMFLDEARIAARIHHPHVVEILDLGESHGAYYMVMEFIEGENLAALVRALEGERLPISVVLQILADTLEGLGAAHELRDADGRLYHLVHRDISPHNILINLDGWSKVGDFGIMKAAGKASNTRTGELRGKLAYMSPEQARGDGQVDHRTDLFAVGVIAWELLTGQRLFACSTEAATLEKVIACAVPALADARPELVGPIGHPQLHAGLDTLLGRALVRDPGQRWADAGEMLSEVKRMLRLADELDGAIDPREVLGKAMRRFFLRRVDYARAALRRTGEHDALVTSPREWAVEPTQQLGRTPSDRHAAAESGLPGSGEAEPNASTGAADLSAEPTRSPTGPQLELGGSSATHTLAARGPGSHWLMWLLLPMLGAGIAVAAMMVIGPDLQRGDGPAPASQVSAPLPDSPTQIEHPSDIARRSPTTLAAGNVATEYTVPKRPPGTIRWWFSPSPKGARVFIDGEPQGTTPTFVHVPIGENPIEIRLELEGYEPHTLQLPPANDQTFAPELQPLADVIEDKPASKKRARKSTAPVEAVTPSEPVPGKKTFVPVPDSLRDSG